MTKDEIRKRVLHAIQKALPRRTVTVDTLFESLGIDSIEAMGVVFAVEEEFDVDFTNVPSRSIRGVEDVTCAVFAQLAVEDKAPT